MTGLRHFAPGEVIPGAPHGVSVSIPDIASVIGFESGDPATRVRIPRGYPRFRTHPFVERLAEHLREEGLRPRSAELVLTRSIRSARAAAAFAGLDPGSAFAAGAVSGVSTSRGDARIAALRSFIQHTGGHMSSRQAEDLLLEAGRIDARHREPALERGGEQAIASSLAAAYGAADPADVSLHASGMNAVYAAIAALAEAQRRRGRHVWIQLGWIFFDTVELLKKGVIEGEHVMLPSPFQLEALADRVRARGGEVAGIVAEVASNPLIQTPDLEGLRAIARDAGCALVLDATIATPHNVDVLPYADVVCESLTKYATGSADVLLGAAVVNRASPFADAIRAGLRRHGEPPYARDAARAAHGVLGYGARMRRVNESALEAARFFEESGRVRRVFWAYDKDSAESYARIQRREACPGGLLMLDLALPIERIYDRLRLAKGPSFGWEYTMAAPQVFVAHFELLRTAAGRRRLARHGLHRDMLRVSIGTEPSAQILSVFDDAFRAAG